MDFTKLNLEMESEECERERTEKDFQLSKMAAFQVTSAGAVWQTV